ncbi:carbonic anhydrase [Catenaria anguillulae PL171]|uniref:Carbonic anhydrase n=1 Tax=Catenaria anguillulae PL171 TaxID=765915 RepID=A0A1Y2HND3_9FUNG|nr:carbonic anhydrase [Catenaria anguillulae PL171]
MALPRPPRRARPTTSTMPTAGVARVARPHTRPRRPPTVPGSFNTLPELLKANKTWAANMVKLDPNFFANLANQQSPQLLWIGCSDSRVPANQIINLAPGEVFVHRNIANVVNHGDLNALSVLQYAVDVLKVKHVIVTGHYGCGGVAASMTNQQFGLIDNWLRTIKDVYQANEAKLDALKDPKAKLDLMVELNVANSVRNVCATTIVQNAWKRGQELSVHGWCYRLEDGVIRDLDICISQPEQISRIYNVMSGKTVANA